MNWNILNQFKKELDLQLSNILSTSYTQGEGIYRKFIYPKKDLLTSFILDSIYQLSKPESCVFQSIYILCNLIVSEF